MASRVAATRRATRGSSPALPEHHEAEPVPRPRRPALDVVVVELGQGAGQGGDLGVLVALRLPPDRCGLGEPLGPPHHRGRGPTARWRATWPRSRPSRARARATAPDRRGRPRPGRPSPRPGGSRPRRVQDPEKGPDQVAERGPGHGHVVRDPDQGGVLPRGGHGQLATDGDRHEAAPPGGGLGEHGEGLGRVPGERRGDDQGVPADRTPAAGTPFTTTIGHRQPVGVQASAGRPRRRPTRPCRRRRPRGDAAPRPAGRWRPGRDGTPRAAASRGRRPWPSIPPGSPARTACSSSRTIVGRSRAGLLGVLDEHVRDVVAHGVPVAALSGTRARPRPAGSRAPRGRSDTPECPAAPCRRA